MFKRILPATVALIAAGMVGSALAAKYDAPPPPAYAGDVEPAQQTLAPPARTLEPKAPQEGMSIAPSEADMERARADRERGVKPKIHSKETKIEAVRDQDNRVKEYVVTPGSTQIPYTIENQAERPIDSTPGGNSKSTLGTTKFIQFGW